MAAPVAPRPRQVERKAEPVIRAPSTCRPAARDESGFTLVELLVTMMVIAGCLLGLIAIQLRALEATTMAKQRQQATALANRTMEQVRAMNPSDVEKGLHTSDLVGDANINVASGRFQPTYDPAMCEPLVAGATQTTGPLYPHRQTTTMGATTYTTQVYVTYATFKPNPPKRDDGFNVTVVATWQSNVTKQKVKVVTVRSRVFAPPPATPPPAPSACP